MKIALIIIAVLLIAILAVMAYYGVFGKVKITEKECGGETLVYQNMVGSYSQSGEVSDKVYADLLEKYKIETTKGFGLYYDNPKEVAKEKLKSKVGCILEEKDATAENLEALKADFKTEVYPKKNYIVIEFPYKGMMSVMVGVFKVYPALNKYSNEKGYSDEVSIMELWDVANGKIVYRKEIVK